MSKDQRGEKNTRAKLTWDSVRHIRKRWLSDEDVNMVMLAEEYDVAVSTIHNVISHKSWKEDYEEESTQKYF